MPSYISLQRHLQWQQANPTVSGSSSPREQDLDQPPISCTPLAAPMFFTTFTCFEFTCSSHDNEHKYIKSNIQVVVMN